MKNYFTCIHHFCCKVQHELELSHFLEIRVELPQENVKYKSHHKTMFHKYHHWHFHDQVREQFKFKHFFGILMLNNMFYSVNIVAVQVVERTETVRKTLCFHE